MKNRIKQLREAKGWSAERLAEEAGTSQQQIDRLEKGQRRMTTEWIHRISLALGCDGSDLIPELVAKDETWIKELRALGEEAQKEFEALFTPSIKDFIERKRK